MHIGVVVHDVVTGPVVDCREMLLGDRHADAHGKTLAQRTGGHFHPVGVTVLGMAGGNRTVLAKLLQILNADFVACQVQYGVQHGGRVSIGQHEAIAIGPFGIRRVVAHELMKEEIHGG